MIEVIRETIKASKMRTVCLYGFLLVSAAELGRRTIVPVNWSGHASAAIALSIFGFGLAMTAFFPPAPLRRVHYMVFYVAFALLGIEQSIWRMVASYSEIRTPWWILALNAILFLVMIGALFLGEKILNRRLHIALIMLIFAAIPTLIYIFMR